MKLHIFNPEHDIALAINKYRFTPPHAGRQLRADLGFIPALWADNGDWVLVDDKEAAEEAARHLVKYAGDVRFVETDDLQDIADAELNTLAIEPWGWDSSVCFQLVRANPALKELLPEASRLEAIRNMSSRTFAADRLLPELTCLDKHLVGRSVYCSDVETVRRILHDNGSIVMKSPWSSSGRGVRYIENGLLTVQQEGWINNIIARQGGVMVEPLYRKVLDFGMEFSTRADGGIDYCGLSMFATSNGAYTGSMLATESDKREILRRYCDEKLLDMVCESIVKILSPLFSGTYEGPFGIDMMIVATDNVGTFMLHPCVELNLRRTMGHVALAVSPSDVEPQRVMNIAYSGKYHLRIHKTNTNTLKHGLV